VKDRGFPQVGGGTTAEKREKSEKNVLPGEGKEKRKMEKAFETLDEKAVGNFDHSI